MELIETGFFFSGKVQTTSPVSPTDIIMLSVASFPT